MPAAVSQHLPGTVWVQQPQWAQHAALGHQLGVVEVKGGGLTAGRLVLFRLQDFSQKGRKEAVEQHSKRRVHVVQRVDAHQLMGGCKDRGGLNSYPGGAHTS